VPPTTKQNTTTEKARTGEGRNHHAKPYVQKALFCVMHQLLVLLCYWNNTLDGLELLHSGCGTKEVFVFKATEHSSQTLLQVKDVLNTL